MLTMLASDSAREEIQELLSSNHEAMRRLLHEAQAKGDEPLRTHLLRLLLAVNDISTGSDFRTEALELTKCSLLAPPTLTKVSAARFLLQLATHSPKGTPSLAEVSM